MIRIQTVGTTLLIASLVSGLSACGKTIDPEKMTTSISEKLGTAGIPVESLECPDDIALEQGDRFECQLVLEGDKEVTVEVVQKDDEGNVDWQARGLILRDKLEETIQSQIKSQAEADFTVDCGEDKAIVALKDESFDCVATDAEDRSITIKVTPTDNFGNVQFVAE